MSPFRFLLPGAYFVQSRLNSLKDFIFHFYYEWLISFILLYYFSGESFGQCLLNFMLAYLAFIAIYEIGYLGNDHYSVKFEEKPRRRLTDFNPQNRHFVILILTRLAAFLCIGFYLKVLENPNWWCFYLFLAIAFTGHNLIRTNKLRGITFFFLTLFRFFAPFFIFLTTGQLLLLLPSVLLCYVFYRCYNYLVSKDIIAKPPHSATSYKVVFYLLNVVAGIGLSVFFTSYLPVLIAAYYLFFWLIVYGNEKLNPNFSL